MAGVGKLTVPRAEWDPKNDQDDQIQGRHRSSSDGLHACADMTCAMHLSATILRSDNTFNNLWHATDLENNENYVHADLMLQPATGTPTGDRGGLLDLHGTKLHGRGCHTRSYRPLDIRL